MYSNLRQIFEVKALQWNQMRSGSKYLSQSQSSLNQSITIRNASSSMNTVSNINPLRPNNDLTQTSHCNIKGLSVSES